MNTFKGSRLSTDLLETHHYICDLVHLEFSLVSLYSDGRRNWIYLWCDTNSADRQRWLVFAISRKALVAYLEKEKSLLNAANNANLLLVLEERTGFHDPDSRDQRKRKPRRYLWQVTPESVAGYLPTTHSFFDPDLAPDLDLNKQVIPTKYDLPISGTWFGRDFEYLFKRYERIYAFFYATRPRVFKTVNESLAKLLRMAWTGGASRVHLYSRLAEIIPGIHSLKVEKLQFASPGDIQFEAIQSIGHSIRLTTLLYIEHEATIEESHKSIKKILTAAHLNKTDLSEFSDQGIRLDERQWEKMIQSCATIGKALQIEEELASLKEHSPNSVVYAKAVNSFVRQVMKLATLQKDDMLNFASPGDV